MEVVDTSTVQMDDSLACTDPKKVVSGGFVSVIIFSKNRSFQLHKCLESLHRFVTLTSKHEMQVNVLYTGKYVCLGYPWLCRTQLVQVTIFVISIHNS